MNHRIPRKPWLPLLVLLGGSTPTRPAAAASPPDGYVVWQSDRLDAREEIYRSRGDGSEVTRLTQTGGLLPLFAPDGRWIAFHDDANTGYLIRPDGSERQTLSGMTPWFWLHDNSGVVVTQAGLWYVLDPETLETTLLIRPEQYPQFAGSSFILNSITHDNRYLLVGSNLYINGYTGANGSFTSDFSAVIIDQFHKDKTYYLGSGCWPITSPAGDLVFHVCADCPTHPDLYRMNLADLATRSSYAAEVAHPDADWGHEYNPRVSNDNQWLAYMASTGCHAGECDYDIWLHQIGTAPSERLRITQDPSFDGYPNLFVGQLWQKTTQPRLLLTPWKLAFFALQGALPVAQTIKVKNAGGGTLGALTVTTDATVPWLDVVYDGAGSIAFSVRGDAIRQGTWQATVTVTADGAVGSPTVVPITLKADESFPSPDAGVPVAEDAGGGEAGESLGMDASVVDAPDVDAPVAPVVDAPVANSPVDAWAVDAYRSDSYAQGVPAFDATATGGAIDAGTKPANSSSGCGCAVGGAARASSALSLLIMALVLGTLGRRRWPLAGRLAALAALACAIVGCATAGGGAPSGSDEQPTDAERNAMATVGGKAKGQIVWSSSRLGNHDLFVMNSDGSSVHAITQGDAVDWFPRFSPDGARILFTRSKKGWVYERDANTDGKWDIFTVTPDGKEETKVVDNASWGGWLSNDEIVYVRSTAVFRRKLAGGDETLLVDSAKEKVLDGALLQQPELSKDGAFVAITLRGSMRETGIWDLKKKTWTRTGEGCQINWTPAGDEIYWVHPTGNGGSRVLHLPVAEGKPSKSDADLDAITLIDLPGRRSHEYFPQLSADGRWLVWAATQRGHDHDIADYEIYLWEVGTPADTAVRLTYHSGNDRWPDIFLPAAAHASPAPAPSHAPPAKEKK